MHFGSKKDRSRMICTIGFDPFQTLYSHSGPACGYHARLICGKRPGISLRSTTMLQLRG